LLKSTGSKEIKMDKSTDKIIQKTNFNPAETLFSTGIVVKATSLDSERIKHFILEETSAKLVYQHQDIAYLKIVRDEN
jgi:hypothetical protein